MDWVLLAVFGQSYNKNPGQKAEQKVGKTYNLVRKVSVKLGVRKEWFLKRQMSLQRSQEPHNFNHVIYIFIHIYIHTYFISRFCMRENAQTLSFSI
jgi:hypothetical protein